MCGDISQALEYAPGRKVAIIGDILELGEFGPDIHEETGQAVGSLRLDVIICVGELAANMADGAKRTDTSGSADPRGSRHVSPAISIRSPRCESAPGNE